MRKLQFAAALTLAAVVIAAPAAQAQVIWSYTGGTQRTDGGIVAGNTFTAFGGQTFNSLGFIDIGDDGLAQSYTVGIFDTATQTLLQSTTVTPTSPLINGFRYGSIPTTTIPHGTQFTIAALLPPGTVDPWMDDTNNILGVGFTGAGQGQYLASGTLVFPTTFADGNYAIANASPVVVPEPGVLALAAGGAGALLLRRRRVETSTNS
jgi:hypothetical protein